MFLSLSKISNIDFRFIFAIFFAILVNIFSDVFPIFCITELMPPKLFLLNKSSTAVTIFAIPLVTAVFAFVIDVAIPPVAFLACFSKL